MRTTLTIEDDVAVLLERVRKQSKTSLKKTVNDALRFGLREMSKPSQTNSDFCTKTVSLGRCNFANIDDISEVIELAENETYK